MDVITTHYREIIRGVLAEYARYKPSYGEVETELIVDSEQRHFELMYVGWTGSRRVHGALIHIDLIGDQVWVQHDGTEEGVVNELLDAGIPRNAIVLAFHPPYLREETGFATGHSAAPTPA